MAKLIFLNTGDEVEIEDGACIGETCEDQGVPLACAEGVCGTCIITIESGEENLSPLSDRERDFLGDDPKNERLACQCFTKQGTVTVSY